MPSLDVFNNDAFSVRSLTAAINEPVEGNAVPDDLAPLFTEKGITTTTIMVERKGDLLKLIPVGARGAPGEPQEKAGRNAIPIATVHLPEIGGINADEVQGVRAFGSETEVQSVQALVNEQLANMRANIDATIAYHRIGAIKGQVLDADGSTVVHDLWNLFGVTQQTKGFALTTDTTKVRIKALEAKRLAENVLGGSSMIRGWKALCGRGFFDALISHNDVEKAYDRWQEGGFLRSDPRAGFPFADVEWKELYGSVGGISFIGDDDAYLVPMGVRGLFVTNYAPADYMETVNTVGLPYYAKQELRKFNKGVDLEAQSNPLNICTRPRAIIKLTKV